MVFLYKFELAKMAPNSVNTHLNRYKTYILQIQNLHFSIFSPFFFIFLKTAGSTRMQGSRDILRYIKLGTIQQNRLKQLFGR